MSDFIKVSHYYLYIWSIIILAMLLNTEQIILRYRIPRRHTSVNGYQVRVGRLAVSLWNVLKKVGNTGAVFQ